MLWTRAALFAAAGQHRGRIYRPRISLRRQTDHARADQNDCENLAVLMASAGCNYFMAVPMGDDVMLSYQSTSYHDASALRAALKMRPAPEFEAWCEQRGILHEGRLTSRAGDARLLINSSARTNGDPD